MAAGPWGSAAMNVDAADFTPWLERWALEPDGAAFATHSSRLMPVRKAGEAAFLKVAQHAEEMRGGAVMAWYAGDGAAAVLAHDHQAVLLERLDGPRSLAAMARGGDDDAACRILCETVARLQGPRAAPLPRELIPLDRWFRELWPTADRLGGLYGKAAQAARELLASSGPPVVLHGDIHHDNVLDGGARGWRAIDPKGVLGERGYDYAPLIGNPDAATALANFDRRVTIAVDLSGLTRRRVLMWVLGYMGLSASWTLSIDGDPRQALAIGARAAAELGL